jgi:pilus assembly protein Flp/PilA
MPYARSPTVRLYVFTDEPSRKGGNTQVTIFTTWLSSLLRKEEGQGLAEYALILALIAVIAIAALVFLGTQIRTILSTIGAQI